MDGLTNILLITLIGLIGYIGKIFYEKLESFGNKINTIIESDIKSNMTVEQIKKNVDDHEVRINVLEKVKL
jgi:hypothetical protein